MKVLVIFEQTDEQTIKAIVGMTSEDYEFFKDANNYIINYSEHDAHKVLVVNTIENALNKSPLDESQSSLYSAHEKLWCGRFSDSVIDRVSDIKDVDNIIICGFFEYN